MSKNFMEENLKNMYDSYSKILEELEKENQQLKQELKDERAELQQLYSHLGVEAFGEDIQEQAVKKIDKIEEENQQLKQQLEEWKDGTIICKWTDAENKVKELEQQLHDLPKKIVGEIRIEMGGIENILINCGNGKEDALCWFNKILQTILKKYGGGNED